MRIKIKNRTKPVKTLYKDNEQGQYTKYNIVLLQKLLLGGSLRKLLQVTCQ